MELYLDATPMKNITMLFDIVPMLFDIVPSSSVVISEIIVEDDDENDEHMIDEVVNDVEMIEEDEGEDYIGEEEEEPEEEEVELEFGEDENEFDFEFDEDGVGAVVHEAAPATPERDEPVRDTSSILEMLANTHVTEDEATDYGRELPMYTTEAIMRELLGPSTDKEDDDKREAIRDLKGKGKAISDEEDEEDEVIHKRIRFTQGTTVEEDVDNVEDDTEYPETEEDNMQLDGCGDLLELAPSDDYRFCVEDDHFDNGDLEDEIRIERWENEGI